MKDADLLAAQSFRVGWLEGALTRIAEGKVPAYEVRQYAADQIARARDAAKEYGEQMGGVRCVTKT